MQPNSTSIELALIKGRWVKIICGASNEDLPSISDLCALYAAAGVQCIDIAADLAVANAARQGLDWVESRFGVRPWLMMSINDGKDIHFRKAFFNSNLCPPDCLRPCEKVCPAEAIIKEVIEDRNKKGLHVEAVFGGVRDIRIKDVKLNKKNLEANITMVFQCDITYSIKDKNNKIIEGGPDKVKKQKDVWTFTRKMNSDIPNWYLTKTE